MLGSVVGLVVAGQLSDAIGGLGKIIALCGIAPIVAAIFLVPGLPETGGPRTRRRQPVRSLSTLPLPWPTAIR